MTGSLRTQSARHRVDHGTICGRTCANSGHYKALCACVDRTFVNPNSSHRRPEKIRRSASGEDYPIGCIGYSYCLERIAALKDKTDIEKVRTLCREGIDATRFLRSHSSLGSEASHVEETIAFVASLPAKDRISVVQETYESALIMAEGYDHELLKSEAEMLEEVRQAIGEALPYSRGSVPLDTEERGTRPVA